MTAHHAAAKNPGPLPQPPAAAPGDFTVATRFGALAGRWDAVLEMPQGPLGFAVHRRFALLQIPNPKLEQFRLMQSLEDTELSFIVMPCAPEDGPIAASDLVDAVEAAGMPIGDLTLLVIVTVRPLGEGVELTANLRAPVLLDHKRHLARQVVLGNAAYAIRHPLGASAPTP
jgi:flagellar assembly factor FliW